MPLLKLHSQSKIRVRCYLCLVDLIAVYWIVSITLSRLTLRLKHQSNVTISIAVQFFVYTAVAMNSRRSVKRISELDKTSSDVASRIGSHSSGVRCIRYD